jgi:hypothetical protein
LAIVNAQAQQAAVGRDDGARQICAGSFECGRPAESDAEKQETSTDKTDFHHFPTP